MPFMVLVLVGAALLWTVEARGARELSGRGEAVALHSYALPAGPVPGILCGCTEVLRNFA